MDAAYASLRENLRPHGIARNPDEYGTESDGGRSWGYNRVERGINILYYDYVRYRSIATNELLSLRQVDASEDKKMLGFSSSLGFDFVVQSQSKTRREQGKTYRVEIAGRFKCACDDYKATFYEKCKHIIACQYFIQYVKEGIELGIVV